jgi:hypothetical protein
LIEPIKEPAERERYTAAVASAISATDPDRAVALGDALGEDSRTAALIRTEVAYRLGPERPDAAIRIVEGIKGYEAVKFRAEAFGWLAVAQRDPARARALIDRALAMPLDQPDRFARLTDLGAGTASAAWIAACARRAGYSDMDSVIARVMATRFAGRRRMDATEKIQAATIAAEVLALTDPAAARQILRDLDARTGWGAAELGKVARDQWLVAWALADREHAERLFDADFVAVDGPLIWRASTGRIKMATILTIAPERREAYLRREHGGTWHPDLQGD